ncbi:VanZ like family protein [Gillisia sp. Hel1_33_143]|nr:VanZ like family protein [Gillisia sp. Hel1_33_143]
MVYTGVVTTLSLIKLGKISVGDFNPTDKMMHTSAYLVLGCVWFFYYVMKNSQQRNYKADLLKIAVLVILFGMLIEVLQGTLTSYRTPDWYDMLANSLGVLIAFLIFIFFKKSFNHLKQKINLFL